jgi:hypothetical protein
VLRLAARVPLAIVPFWPGAQPPKWQLKNPAEGGWGGADSGRGVVRRGAGGEKFSLASFCLRQLCISHVNYPIPGAFPYASGCVRVRDDKPTQAPTIPETSLLGHCRFNRSKLVSPFFSGLDWEGLAPKPQGLLGLSPGHRVLPKLLLHPCKLNSASAPVYPGVTVLGVPGPSPALLGALTRESPSAILSPLLRSPSIYSGPQHSPPPTFVVIQLLTEQPESRRRDAADRGGTKVLLARESEFLRPRRPQPLGTGAPAPPTRETPASSVAALAGPSP